MKKQTVVTVVYFLEESTEDEVKYLIDSMSAELNKNESYQIVNIEDIEQ